MLLRRQLVGLLWKSSGLYLLAIISRLDESKLLTKAILLVHLCRSAFQDAESTNDGRWHTILWLVDPEIFQRSLCLCTPVLVGWYLDLAKGVCLCSSLSSHDRCGAEGSNCN